MGRLRLWLWLTAMLAALEIIYLPRNLNLDAFAFGDSGVTLNAVYLVRHGFHPGIDFGYPYGLLGIFFADLWFRLAGLSPLAFFFLIILAEAGMAAFIADILAVAGAPRFSVLLVVVSLPLFMWINYLNIAHALEAFFLLAAMAAQIRGRYGLAVAAAGAAVLSRPSLGFVYGLVLLCLALRPQGKTRFQLGACCLRLAAPAAACGLLAAVLGWRFGFGSLARTLVPLSAMASYKALGYGFFGLGRAFWWPSPWSLRFYFGTPGFWLLAVGTALLLGPVAGFRSVENRERAQSHAAVGGSDRGAREQGPSASAGGAGEVLLAAAAVLFAWVFFGFGHAYIGSWILYLFMAVLGVALLGCFFPRLLPVAVLLALLAVNAERHNLQDTAAAWRGVRWSRLFPHLLVRGKGRQVSLGDRGPGMREGDCVIPGRPGGFPGDFPDEDCEWRQILAAVQGRPTAVLMNSGAFRLMRRGLGEPVNVFFLPGIATTAETARMQAQVAAAELLIVPTPPWYQADTEIYSWPQLLDPAARYLVVLRNSSGMVLARAGRGAE
jgi:hypothetical protein